MGHKHEECGTGEHKEEDLQFAAWMVAPEVAWHPSTPRVRKVATPNWEGRSAAGNTASGRAGRNANHGGGRAGRGGARGAGRAGIWKEKEG
jgi:hypothetical protein